jgi:hypothetical protein
MGEQVFEHLPAVAFGELVDALDKAGIAIEHLPAGNRVGQKHRVDDGRPAAALLVGHRRAGALAALPHMLPELLDVVGRGHPLEAGFDLVRETVVGRVHVGEFGAAQSLAVAVRDADAVEHVHKPRHRAVRHVGMPVLAGVGAADVSPVFLQVRQDVDFRVLARLVRQARHAAALDFAEPLGKPLQVPEAKMLVGKAQHPVAAQRQEDLSELELGQRLRQVDPVRRRPEHRARWFDRQHGILLHRATHRANLAQIRRPCGILSLKPIRRPGARPDDGEIGKDRHGAAR